MSFWDMDVADSLNYTSEIDLYAFMNVIIAGSLFKVNFYFFLSNIDM